MHLEFLKMRDGGWEKYFHRLCHLGWLEWFVELIEVDWYSQMSICRRSKAAALGNEERCVCVTHNVCVCDTATKQ